MRIPQINPDFSMGHIEVPEPHKAELAALRAFVRELACQDPGQPIGQRQSNKERAEDLCEQWGITA